MDIENTLILEQAALLYKVSFVREIRMGVTGNRVFEVKKGEKAYILRASEYTPEKEEHTAFELKWMKYLSDHLAQIVQPQKSVHDKLYEVFTTANKSYLLCLFEKAPGKIVDVNNPSEFNKELFFNLGVLMGNIHKLTIKYEGNIPTSKFDWYSSEYSWRNQNVIMDEEVRQYQKKYRDEIRKLPIHQDHYGIIHWDIHTDNFHVDHGHIKLFDFDACEYNWYTADIASAVFFMIQKGAGPLTNKSEKERTEFAETYLISYLKGYLQTNTISEYWIKKIDLFMKYQMCDEYLATQNGWPEELSHLRDGYLNWHKERIINDLPYAFIDYEKVINSLPEIKDNVLKPMK